MFVYILHGWNKKLCKTFKADDDHDGGWKWKVGWFFLWMCRSESSDPMFLFYHLICKYVTFGWIAFKRKNIFSFFIVFVFRLREAIKKASQTKKGQREKKILKSIMYPLTTLYTYPCNHYDMMMMLMAIAQRNFILIFLSLLCSHFYFASVIQNTLLRASDNVVI